MVRILSLAISILVISSGMNAQKDTVKLMQYNLLMFPESNPEKAIHLQRILEYVQPDIISLNELTSSAAIDSIYSVVDTTKYTFGPFYPDEIISNALMYNKQKLGLSSSFAFQTSPRKTHIYKLYSKNQDFFAYPDTVFMNVGVVHFKSSQGATNQNIRFIQATDITDYIRVFEPDNFILAGDYNMYSSNEPAYQELIAPADDYLVDPINRPGNWNNNGSFADIHTQSPRTTSFDGGVTGGLDDRFDIVLVLDEIIEGTGGLRYLPGTYVVPGNDGNHFNKSILDSPLNTSAPEDILQALHAMSDHLPVVMDFELDPANVSTGLVGFSPAGGCCDSTPKLFSESENKSWSIYNLSGKQLANEKSSHLNKINLSPGLYLLMIEKSGCRCNYKMLVKPDLEILFSH